jgi:Skp family chaperone for outer membrane proteins
MARATTTRCAVALYLVLLAGGIYPAYAQQAQPVIVAQPLPFPTRSIAACINLQRVAAQSKTGAAAFAKIGELSKQAAARIGTKTAEVAALKASAGAAGGDAVTRAEAELDQLRRSAQAEIQALQMRVEQEFQKSVFPIVEAVGKEKGIYFVFSATATGFVWFDDAVDISDEVIRRLDALPAAKQ